MKAVVLSKPVTATNLIVQEVPIPEVKPGWVLVKIKAFGINRSEVFTRRGESPSVKLPRIIGIECAGEIFDPSDSTFSKGQKVISMMGGLGRQFDGSYAEYALIPAIQVYAVDTDMDWVQLAAIPEMYYTAFASLFDVLMLDSQDVILIRGGTSSVGIAALQLAKSIGAIVISTTRTKAKVDMLKQYGADHVLLDDESIQQELETIIPKGVNKVLELIGTVTLQSSLNMLAPRGVLCMAGILGGQWVMNEFEPMSAIRSGTYFTQFDSEHIKSELVTELLHYIHKHEIKAPIAKVFTLDQIGEAHQLMEQNIANGKIIINNL
ncbi:zinc-binding alcohol dehydrogenase family protein [Paenibacillus sp. PsM32]|uniref:zinc-binding alcohol dehydrogenase family protein n=1 Tax=Paenibacillus sp. PsM32 TaxID=3030536 RepID=UPI00263A5627|nr:zinc-binding alcohol dehydrogenase family protein [Paenibacillus sp. PsM32]MDN4618147.1 zinc-binding alcohol dehydrogenase family protein [Paenibacillus sp. PsM32]